MQCMYFKDKVAQNFDWSLDFKLETFDQFSLRVNWEALPLIINHNFLARILRNVFKWLTDLKQIISHDQLLFFVILTNHWISLVLLECNTITIIPITLDWWQIASSSHARVSQCLVSCNKDACTQRKPAFVEPRARIIIIFTVIIKVVDPCTHAWSSFSTL